MKAKRTIIHVGFPKTATTFLQEVFFSKLKDVTYLGRQFIQQNTAFNMIQYADQSMYSIDIVKEEIERINNFSSDHKTILLSDEVLVGFPYYNFINRTLIAERLSEVLPHAEIILFLRSQDDLILSLYNQLVKMGRFSEPLNQNFIHKPGKGYDLDQWFSGQRGYDRSSRFVDHRSLFNVNHFKYSSLIDLYTKLFSKVHVFLFEDFVNDSENTLTSICSILKTDAAPSDILEAHNMKIVNKRLDDAVLQRKIIENRINAAFSIKNANGRKLSRITSKLMSYNVKQFETSNRQYVLSLLDDEKVFDDNFNVNQKYHLGMERYSEKYFRTPTN